MEDVTVIIKVTFSKPISCVISNTVPALTLHNQTDAKRSQKLMRNGVCGGSSQKPLGLIFLVLDNNDFLIAFLHVRTMIRREYTKLSDPSHSKVF